MKQTSFGEILETERFQEQKPPKTERFLIYRSDKAKNLLCIVAAKNKKHALTVARRYFQLDRTALAIPEKLKPEKM